MVEKPYHLETRGSWLLASFAEPWAVLSWAIVNGGLQRTSQVAWLYLNKNDLAIVDDPAEWMKERMYRQGCAGAVGFLTSRRLHAFVEAEAADGDCRAWAVGTIGLSNALRAGDPSGPYTEPGTMNLLLCSSRPLTVEAAMESLALISEAKALASVESGLRSVRTGLPATGTGTDYLAVAWPSQGGRASYAGKHTSAGAALGHAAYLAVAHGIQEWQQEFGHLIQP